MSQTETVKKKRKLVKPVAKNDLSTIDENSEAKQEKSSRKTQNSNRNRVQEKSPRSLQKELLETQKQIMKQLQYQQIKDDQPMVTKQQNVQRNRMRSQFHEQQNESEMFQFYSPTQSERSKASFSQQTRSKKSFAENPKQNQQNIEEIIGKKLQEQSEQIQKQIMLQWDQKSLEQQLQMQQAQLPPRGPSEAQRLGEQVQELRNIEQIYKQQIEEVQQQHNRVLKRQEVEYQNLQQEHLQWQEQTRQINIQRQEQEMAMATKCRNLEEQLQSKEVEIQILSQQMQSIQNSYDTIQLSYQEQLSQNQSLQQQIYSQIQENQQLKNQTSLLQQQLSEQETIIDQIGCDQQKLQARLQAITQQYQNKQSEFVNELSGRDSTIQSLKSQLLVLKSQVHARQRFGPDQLYSTSYQISNQQSLPRQVLSQFGQHSKCSMEPEVNMDSQYDQRPQPSFHQVLDDFPPRAPSFANAAHPNFVSENQDDQISSKFTSPYIRSHGPAGQQQTPQVVGSAQMKLNPQNLIQRREGSPERQQRFGAFEKLRGLHDQKTNQTIAKMYEAERQKQSQVENSHFESPEALQKFKQIQQIDVDRTQVARQLGEIAREVEESGALDVSGIQRSQGLLQKIDLHLTDIKKLNQEYELLSQQVLKK